MTQRVYAHLGDVRCRSEEVSFRLGEHVARLGERLAALQASAK